MEDEVIDETNDGDEEDLQEEIEAAFDPEGETMEGFTKDLGNKILGVGYSYEEDCLYVRVREKLFKPVETKKQLLSWISSIYDPLGLISPYMLKGRILFQLVTKDKLGWNDKLSRAS